MAPLDVKRTLNQPTLTDIDQLMMRLRSTAKLMNLSAYATLASGLVIMLMLPVVPWQIWLGLVLTLATIGIGHAIIRPAIGNIVAIRQDNNLNSNLNNDLNSDLNNDANLAKASQKFALGVHSESVLRVIILGLMIFR